MQMELGGTRSSATRWCCCEQLQPPRGAESEGFREVLERTELIPSILGFWMASREGGALGKSGTNAVESDFIVLMGCVNMGCCSWGTEAHSSMSLCLGQNFVFSRMDYTRILWTLNSKLRSLITASSFEKCVHTFQIRLFSVINLSIYWGTLVKILQFIGVLSTLSFDWHKFQLILILKTQVLLFRCLMI